MHASALIRAAGTALAVAILALTSGLADARLLAPTEEQKAQADLAEAKAAWGDRVAAFQVCKVQDKAAASHQAGGKTAYTQPDAPCMGPGPFVASVPAALAPAPAVKG